jgi:Domain of unknown function (DUF4440)
MRWHMLILPATVVLAVALPPPGGARAATPTDNEPAPSPRRLEVARLQAHFDSVDAELRDAKGPQLTSSQRVARATLIGWLRQYRNAGEFPRNERFANRPMPFFRDGHGALCAMAYLIERSGRHDLVDRIAITRNNAFIAELAADPALRAWLDSVGLSANEAARIQPTYTPMVEASVARYDSAWNRRDTSTVGRILAPQYQYFTSLGGVSSRAESMAMLSDPGYRLERASRSEIKVAMSGPVAVVSSRWQGQGTYRGQPFKDDQRCGQTWLLSDPHRETPGAGELRDTREWQLLSEHCVQIAPATSPASSE